MTPFSASRPCPVSDVDRWDWESDVIVVGFGSAGACAAIGARVRLELAMKDGSRRAVYAHVNGGGSFGASSLEQEIGLGQAEHIISMEVFWPTTTERQVFQDVSIDTRVEVREGDSDYRVLKTSPFLLGE